MSNIKYPWDLPVEPKRHFVAVPAEIAHAMASGELIEREAIELIGAAVVKVEGSEEWGLNIPILYGFTGGERKFFEKATRMDVNFQRESIAILKRISEASGIPLNELAKAHDNGDIARYMDALEPFLPELNSLQELQPKEAQIIDLWATAHLRRVMPEWRLELTQALPDLLLRQIYLFAEIDRIAPEGKPPA
jgi:hypothetical protein